MNNLTPDERKAMQELAAEVKRKLNLARTSVHANSEKGMATIKKRQAQLNVLSRFLLRY